MLAIVRLLAAFAFVVTMLEVPTGLSFAQNGSAIHPSVPGAAPPSYTGPGWGPEGEPPAAAPESTSPVDLPVLYVTSVEILRASAEPELDIVRVTGLAASEGWSAPQLVPTYAGKPVDGILDLELIATPPAESQDAGGFVQVSAILPLEEGHGFKGVRVRGAENAIAVKQIPGSNQITVRVNDCRSCLGKTFVAEGGTSQTQQGVVRQEDLPKLLRLIKATDGIRGIKQDPNRLTLMLDEGNVILAAFWE